VGDSEEVWFGLLKSFTNTQLRVENGIEISRLPACHRSEEWTGRLKEAQ
jgi:hypothetical protein